MARPEGFEPPTLRSEVSYSSFSHKIAKKRSPLFIGERAFLFFWLRLALCDCGNKLETFFETKTGTASVRVGGGDVGTPPTPVGRGWNLAKDGGKTKRTNGEAH